MDQTLEEVRPGLRGSCRSWPSGHQLLAAQEEGASHCLQLYQLLVHFPSMVVFIRNKTLILLTDKYFTQTVLIGSQIIFEKYVVLYLLNASCCK